MQQHSQATRLPLLWRASHGFDALLGILAALTCGLATGTPAAAHPHVFVNIKSAIIFDANGAITAIRHAWAFDDAFSVFATQGLASSQKGVFTREELAPLAKVNVTSLKEYNYFTYATVGGWSAPLIDPTDHWLDYNDAVLTLHFTLPFKTPMKERSLDLEIYDPFYFVEFHLTEKDPVVLADAPAGCKVSIAKPSETGVAQGRRLGESFFKQLSSSQNWGAQFAHKISVRCP